MKKFEYKIFIGEHRPGEDESMLNELGASGWEVVAVSVVPVQKSGEFFGNKKTCYWLKREGTAKNKDFWSNTDLV